MGSKNPWGKKQNNSPSTAGAGGNQPTPASSNGSSNTPSGEAWRRQPSNAPTNAPTGAWGKKPITNPTPVPSEIPTNAQAGGAWGRKQPAPTNVPSNIPSNVAADASSNSSSGTRPKQSEPFDGEASRGTRSTNQADDRPEKKSKYYDEIATRPKQWNKKGTSGQPIQLQANYFALKSQTDWSLFQYRVDFAPEEERTFVKKMLLRVHAARLGFYLFDGSMLFTNTRLPSSVELNSIREEDRHPMQIKIRLVGELLKGDHHYMQFFNILVRRCLEHLKLQLVGRNYYDPNSRVEVREYNLELWPGYVTSIRQHERAILMCAEISHKVMRNQTLLDLLKETRSNRGDKFMDSYKEAVLGHVVLTDYNNRTYRVDDVDFNMNPMKTFKLRDGEDITYADYYSRKYQITIKNNTQPLLVSRSNARERRAGQSELVYLVPELCRSTGLTEEMRNNFHLMRALSTHTRIGPEQRIQKLMNFNQRLHNQKEINQEFKTWNFALDKNLVHVPARILDPESLIFAQKVLKPKNADWNFDLQSYKPYAVASLPNWIVLCTERDFQNAQHFFKTMVQVASQMSFLMSSPTFEVLKHYDDWSQKLENVLSKESPKLVVCIVPNNQLQRYQIIKKKVCIDRPVPSQIMLSRTLNQKTPSMTRSVACKVAVQINCKIGGIPWTMDISTKIAGLMVVGFDVCHEKSKSYGAMVASLDQAYGRYFSAVTQHTGGEELSDDLSANLKCAIGEFRRVNQNKLPSNIVIYRDGVGEGQIRFVLEYEVKQIMNMLSEVYGGREKVKMCFIIVTKRLNTRFFYGQKNPPPGTVVDDVVTDPLKYDFFIVSQSVRQGTVAPTAYNVIFNTMVFKPDQMQMLTYKFCHMYFNFSGTVRVPAPCQYAHKLAFFASTALNGPAHSSLRNTLYFL